MYNSRRLTLVLTTNTDYLNVVKHSVKTVFKLPLRSNRMLDLHASRFKRCLTTPNLDFV